MKQRRRRADRTQLDDRALVVLATDGDYEAFAALLQRHDDKMRALAFSLLGSRSAMDDALQNAYLKAYRSLDGYRGDAAFSSWLYTIVRSACLDRHRYDARRPRVSLDLVTAEGQVTADHAEGLARRQELRDALASLPTDQMAVVVLIDAEGLSYDEVAETLAISPGTVGSRLSRGRAALRQRLQYDPEGGPR